MKLSLVGPSVGSDAELLEEVSGWCLVKCYLWAAADLTALPLL